MNNRVYSGRPFVHDYTRWFILSISEPSGRWDKGLSVITPKSNVKQPRIEDDQSRARDGSEGVLVGIGRPV